MRREMERQLGRPLTLDVRLGSGFRQLQQEIENRKRALQYFQTLRSDSGFEKALEAKQAWRREQEFISPAYVQALHAERRLTDDRKQALQDPTTRPELREALAALSGQREQ